MCLAVLATAACGEARQVPADGAPGDDGAATTCGAPELWARYEACSQSGYSTCEAAGGQWQLILAPGAPEGEGYCRCPTGQAGCRCTRASQCVAGCVQQSVNTCGDSPEGECAAHNDEGGGCVCSLSADTEEWSVQCVD